MLGGQTQQSFSQPVYRCCPNTECIANAKDSPLFDDVDPLPMGPSRGWGWR